jgi:uncharacterized protein (DUF111 family)
MPSRPRCAAESRLRAAKRALARLESRTDKPSTETWARIELAKARVRTAKSDRDIAVATVKTRSKEAGAKKAVADRTFRVKEFDRCREVAKHEEIPPRLLDELEDQKESAIAAAEMATADVLVAKAIS